MTDSLTASLLSMPSSTAGSLLVGSGVQIASTAAGISDFAGKAQLLVTSVAVISAGLGRVVFVSSSLNSRSRD